MLSVLIPVYNFDIRSLVHALHEQCTASDIEFEILCFDDGSRTDIRKLNATLSQFSQVIYKENKQNVGRSAIRNMLADQASYPYLIFMDGDSGVISDHYIKKYLKHLNPGRLLYGGTFYQENAPKDQALIFHWTYGQKREAMPLAQRKKMPWHAFKTNNFLIPEAIFQQVRFDERLREYGHEDTIFALELKHRQILIEHLDNPLEHLGLEPVDRFLEKTQKAVANLYFLWNTQSQDRYQVAPYV